MSWEATQNDSFPGVPALGSNLQHSGRCIPRIPRGGRARHPRAEAAGPCSRSVDLEALEEAAQGPAGGRTAKPSLTPARRGSPGPAAPGTLALPRGTLGPGSSSAQVLTFINHSALLPFILKPHMQFFPYTTHFKVCTAQYGRCSGSGSFSCLLLGV